MDMRLGMQRNCHRKCPEKHDNLADFGRKQKERYKPMDNLDKTQTEVTQTSTEGKTFTQEDVNRIVQERLAKEKGKGNDELEKRAAELDIRERKLNAVTKLRENGLPDYLVDALNMNTDEDFQKSMEAIIKMKGESTEQPKEIGHVNAIGGFSTGGGTGDDLRSAFGL